MNEWGLFFLWAVIIILFAVLFSSFAFGASATVSWDAVPSADVAGYKVRWRVDGSTTWRVTDVGNTPMFSIAGLPDDKMVWISVQTYDFLGQLSRWTTAKPYCTCTVAP